MHPEFNYVCECSREECWERLPLTQEQFDAACEQRDVLDAGLSKLYEAYIVLAAHAGTDPVLATLPGCVIVQGDS